ncbi:hypothetical protein PMIT1313_02598 [Prochlorococcus marinus str. MIT 1313]|nr:hypothetical protein PMIT1313_02598 [Prochlorococcus marinus str. MIT 1313]
MILGVLHLQKIGAEMFHFPIKFLMAKQHQSKAHPILLLLPSELIRKFVTAKHLQPSVRMALLSHGDMGVVTAATLILMALVIT